MITYKRDLTLDIYDYGGNKICPLFNSLSNVEDQATDVFISTERNGWKELSFSIAADSYRSGFIKADYKIKAREGENVDWYIISSLRLSHDGKKRTLDVTAGHVSQILKIKNLGLEFSDEFGNNVGTAEELLTTVLKGTGWEPGEVTDFKEKNNTTTKRRTLKASTKTGAFKLITMICDLFEAKPVFHGDTRTVDIIPMNPFSHPANGDIHQAVQQYANGNVLELHYGTNVSNVSRQYNTQNMVTKLYVYGSYGDDISKYCGIEECTHTEHRFTLTSSLTAGSTYWFTVNDDADVAVYRNFTPAVDVDSGDVLVWSFLDPASMMYLWNETTQTAYALHVGQEGTELSATSESEEVENVFSFIMDFTYYNDNGLISDSMLQNIAKLQFLGKDYLETVNEAATAYASSWQELSGTIGIIDFVKLDIDSISTKTIDGNDYTKLILTDDRIIYRTDIDATTHFKWRIANSIKANGDAINSEAAVIYVIHAGDPVLYDKYYIRELNDIDDPSELVLWADSGAVSSTDQCYLFQTNGVNGLLGAYESANEANIQALNSATKKATVEHPVFFSQTAPTISTESAAIDLPIPEWLDYNKTYAWWYKYSYTQEGELYFCYYSDGDQTWKRVYVSKTEPTYEAGCYWYDWTKSCIYRAESNDWNKLEKADDKAIAALFGTVYYSCRKYDKYNQGIYQKYTIEGTFAPNNWYMPNEYGDLLVFSTQKAATKFVYDTTDGFLTFTPQDTSLAEESVDVQVKRYDSVAYHPENILANVAVEEGGISQTTGGDINSGVTGYRTSSAPIYSGLSYSLSGITGSVKIFYYTLKHDYMSYETVTAPCTFTTPANTRYIRLASELNLTNAVCHIPTYDTSIIVKDETYYLAGTPTGSGSLKGILPLIASFSVLADETYITNYNALKEAQDAYSEFEQELADELGDLYKESQWQDSNYVDGDEDKLYGDALDNLKQAAKPETTYTITFLDRRCEDMSAIESGAARWPEFDADSAAHLVDPEFDINCWAYIDKVKKCYDKPWKTTITINTNLTTMAQHSFTDVMTNIANVAKSVKAKETVYDNVASGSAKLATERLEGTIDANRTKIMGGSSTWYTNDQGNMVFESADGTSAMMISGNGFALADSKDKYGDWVWRAFGTGQGFSADELVTGFLSADRIEAGSITTDHISSTFGETLDLSSNKGINIKVQQIKKDIEADIDEMIEDSPTISDMSAQISTLSDSVDIVVEEVFPNGTSNQSSIAVNTNSITSLTQDVEGNTSTIEQHSDLINSTVQNSSNAMSTATQTADKLSWIISGDSSAQLSFTSAALNYISENANLSLNNAFGIVLGAVNDIKTWMTFNTNGLNIGKEGNKYSTLIDANGYHIDDIELPVGTHAASFTGQRLTTNGLKIGNIAVQKTSQDGWVWKEV